MLKKLKQKQHSNIAFIAVALLLVCTMTMTAFAAADLSSTIGVTGLTANSSGAKDWTASAGGAVWEGTTTSSGGCSPTYTATDGTLVFTNNSGSTQVLSFDYTLSLNGGSFTVDGAGKTSDGSFSQALANGASVTLVATSSGNAANTTKVTLSNIKLAVQSVNITFAAPTNGSYTMNGTAITANTTVTNPSTTTYKLVATPAVNYHFDGWYLGDTKVYETATVNAAAFATTGTVTARFKIDPLYNQATVPADSKYTKNQLVNITSAYFHDSTEKLVANGGFPGNNSAYSKTAASGTKDKIDVQYIPSLVWNDSMKVENSGTAYGDYKTGAMQESYASVRMMSDVIRIYAKENCNISFKYTNALTTSGGDEERNKLTAIYTYITSSSSANVTNIKTGTKLTEADGSSGVIALSKGDYLYILAEGYVQPYTSGIFSSSQLKANFSYSASISEFNVEYNEKKDILTAGFRDNTGKALGSGTISVNNVGQAIGTDGNMTAMEFADLAAVELKVSAAPANYVHIGWEVTPEGGSATRVYTPTYSRTMTENVTVNALFVPKTTITMGANGYSDATYKDFNGNALNGQYVARNSGCTAYYTSLADAFSKTDTVVLLAGTTIEGDWTIPAGKTFVIPFGMNDAGSTTPVLGWGMGTDYCLVNLNGNLNVAGTLLVSAQQNQSTGATGGNPGHLVVASGKTITVSGSLYAYGPVTGAGKVETTSNAKIHETLEFSDNDVVIYIYNIYTQKSSKKVFPFNTMFLNSIEIPVTYQRGATLTGHVALRYHEVSTAEIPIIGYSNSMMNHTAGTITKYYDHSTGQFVFRYDEGSEVSTGAFSISMDMVIGTMEQTVTMDSADYYVPLSAPFRFEVAGNLTVNGKYKALPGMTFDVKEGGTLTIASGSELVLYRRNDFDYRGKHANSTEQWGYTSKPYPQNPQRFNGVSYPFSFNNSNMGSAKLNVDGTLIVNGGLYVTNELQSDSNITLTADGYNNLTGTGTINMTDAARSLTSISEAMRAGSTNDLAWDTVATVPMKGLKADATADEAAQYESLTGKVIGSTNANGLNVWSADPCAGGHDLTATEAKESNCYQQGNSAYWYCSVCGKYFSDEACTTVIEKDSWLLELAEHTYDEGAVTTEPNCTEKGVKTYTCSVCPEGTDGHTRTEEVAATGHTEVIDAAVAPTCMATGLTEGMHCSVCKAVLTAQTVVEKIDHTWDNGTQTKAPTCSEEGVTTFTCTFANSEGNACGATKTAAITKLSHTEGAVVVENEVAATCAAEGSYDNVVYCSVCNTELSRSTVTVEKFAHTSAAAVEENRVEATCSVAGSYDEVVYCSVCGEEVSRETKALELAAHTEGAVVVENEKAATCTAEGSYDNVVYCTVCNAELSRNTVTVDKIAHTPAAAVEENRVESTCTVAGSYDEVVYCSACNTELSRETKALELAAHTEGAAVVENEKAATCTAEGSYDNVVYCSVCNAELSRNTVTVEKVDHDYEAVVTAPTCTAKGYTTYTCSACGDSYVAGETEMVAHTPADAVKENEVASTCTVAGSYDEVVYCSVCNTELSSETKALELAAHTPGETVVENNVAPTCTAEGSYDNVVYCSVCNAELSRDTVKVPATGHSWVDATFGAPKTCSVCGAMEGSALVAVAEVDGKQYQTLAEAVAAAEEDQTVKLLTDAAIVERLSITRKITLDLNGKTVTADFTDDFGAIYISPKGDLTVTGDGTIVSKRDIVFANFGDLTIENGTFRSEAGEDGYNAALYNMYNERTNDTEEVEVIYGTAVIKNGTFDSEIWNCGYLTVEGGTLNGIDNSGKTIITDGTINGTIYAGDGTDAPKLEDKGTIAISGGVFQDAVENDWCAEGFAPNTNSDGTYGVHQHSYSAVVTAPDCLNGGYTTYTCDICGDSYKGDEKPALGHTEVIDAAVAATCTATGLTEGKHCDVCNTTLIAQTVVNALGHKYDAVVTEPTCTENGYTTYTCSVCGDIYTADTVAATGHTEETVAGKAATCTNTGLTNGVVCSVCDAVIQAQELIPALGHTEEIVPGYGATCTKDGLSDGKKCTVCGEMLVEQTEIPAGHKWNDGTCGVCGEVCGHKFDDENDMVCNICGVGCEHNFNGVVTAPDCDDAGYTTHTCETCGYYYIDSSVAALGHDWEDATCTDPKTCKRCGVTEGEANGHIKGEAVKENDVSPSCTTEGGYDMVTYCTVCGTKLETVHTTVPVTSHTEAEPVVENSVAATCTADGSYDTVVRCSVCSAEMSRETTVVPAAGHTEETVAGKAATCTEPGLTDGVKCSKCGKVLTAQTEIPALGHKHAAVVTAPTCVDQGYTTYTCSACGDSYVDDEVPATGKHNYVDGKCEDCGETGIVEASDLKFYKTSLCFQEYIGLQFIVRQSVLAGYDSHYAVVVQQKPNADTGEVTGYVEERIEMHSRPHSTSTAYRIFNQNIQSWSMTDTVTITLYAVKDGITYKGETITTSVMEQAYIKLGQLAGNSANAPTCKVLADMLVYGAAVQTAFDHDAADLPDAKLEELGYSSFVTATIPEIAAENAVEGTGSVTVRSTSLSLQEKVDLQLIFGSNMSGYKAVVTLADGEPFEVYPDGTGTRKFSLVSLPYKMRETYTVVICNAETNEVVSPTYTYSVESVAKTKLGKYGDAYDNMFYAMMNYGDAVKKIA